MEDTMNTSRFIENIIEQIKEVQLKLGFVKESIRLYYPVESLCRLLQIEHKNEKELLTLLKTEESLFHTNLGKIQFSLSKGRMEVGISSVGAAYVQEYIPNPPFLTSIIQLFQEKHNPSIKEICACFAQFNKDYVCEQMELGQDFDYVLYFPQKEPDAWFYCIRTEMEHTIYHRFTEEDYKTMI